MLSREVVWALFGCGIDSETVADDFCFLACRRRGLRLGDGEVVVIRQAMRGRCMHVRADRASPPPRLTAPRRRVGARPLLVNTKPANQARVGLMAKSCEPTPLPSLADPLQITQLALRGPV